ncbi:MAG: hypothetical protein PHO79_00825 [Desulfoplanes sp.]|nr:hypothetical protein [Desulfoplanes sp.]
MKNTLTSLVLALIFIVGFTPNGICAGIDPHGLSPANDMTFLPHLAGLRNKVFKNRDGQAKHLSEAIVLRQSEIKDGQATINPGGLFYISETSGDARPLMRDPFLLLGEQAYLVDLNTDKNVFKDISITKGERQELGKTGYRLWFDYSTDHYQKPYGEFAVISPSGGWPLEFPIASKFGDREDTRTLELNKGLNPQLLQFYMDKTYYLGASRYVAKDIGFDTATFSSIAFPVVTSATFAMERPVTLEVRQEDYRLYMNKRIYAYRQPDGFLVKVTNLTGSKILAEKLIQPATAQNYKNRNDEKGKYALDVPGEDMRVEIVIDPTFLKNSDFIPWSTGKAHGFGSGNLSFVIYRNLITVQNNQPWPLDKRYNVVLEANPQTGMLQRLLLENNTTITLDNAHDTYKGPVKYSEILNRPAFKIVANGFNKKTVHNLYVRDYYAMRTDNMVMWAKEGKENLDFFLGSSPVLEPMIERSFLQRLADSSLGTITEESHFTSYPKVVSSSEFYEPDHTAPLVARFKGLDRKIFRNRNHEKLLSAEAVVIRGSYVDYKHGRIVIPPAGLCYTTRNARNIRSLAAEPFFMLGEKAYLTTFTSGTYVLKNLNLDFWKNQPMGDTNLMYWQDQLLGVRNKALRYTGMTYLDDRPVASLSLMKYSGNRWGSHFFIAQGFDQKDPYNRYYMPEIFAEGSTFIVPDYVGSNYVRIKEFATPSINAISYTLNNPQGVLLGTGDTAHIGDKILRCTGMDTQLGTVRVEISNTSGTVLASKVLGPLNADTNALLPQHMETARTMQLRLGSVMVEMDVKKPFKQGKARLYTYTGIEDIERDTPYKHDPRFMVRPDVCGHCYQFNELLLDNPQAIVLDKDHPTYDGPKDAQGQPLFTLVIDSFDGEMIMAWHIEGHHHGKTCRTDNLAFRPRNNVDVLLGINGTTEGFLRLSMLPRLAFREAWRTGQSAPAGSISGAVNTGGSAHIRR